MIVMSRLAQPYLEMASLNKDEVLGFFFCFSFWKIDFDVSFYAAKAR